MTGGRRGGGCAATSAGAPSQDRPDYPPTRYERR